MPPPYHNHVRVTSEGERCLPTRRLMLIYNKLAMPWEIMIHGLLDKYSPTSEPQCGMSIHPYLNGNSPSDPFAFRVALHKVRCHHRSVLGT
jgi:hypothetical protein